MYTLTVAIPNYNHAKNLETCVNSILSQTLLPSEILIVDDCSTDNSADVISRLVKKSAIVRGIFLQRNKGVSHARNTALSQASGKYITFIDADDIYYSSKKLENEIALIRKYKEHNNSDIVSYSKIVFLDSNLVFRRSSPSNPKEYLTGNIHKRLLLSIHSHTIMRDYCVSTELIRKIGGYNEQSSLYEDLELLYNLSACCDFYCTFEDGTGHGDSVDGLSKKSKNVLKSKEREILNAYLKTHYGFTKRIMFKICRIICFLAQKISRYAKNLLCLNSKHFNVNKGCRK